MQAWRGGEGESESTEHKREWFLTLGHLNCNTVCACTRHSYFSITTSVSPTVVQRVSENSFNRIPLATHA
jgi:hypothetical protein